jgi:excisionase family DNA binding protein
MGEPLKVYRAAQAMEEALNVYRAAQVLGTSPIGVYKLVSRRQIPFRKNGRRLIFLRSELEQFLRGLPGMSLADLTTRDRRP